MQVYYPSGPQASQQGGTRALAKSPRMPHNNYINQRESMGKSIGIELISLFVVALTAPLWAGAIGAVMAIGFGLLVKFPIPFLLAIAIFFYAGLKAGN